MILNTAKFNTLVEKAGLTEEQLAQAIDRPGLDAISAIRNWRRQRFSPRPTPADLTNLANLLGVPRREIVRYQASHNWARISARKARLVADLIRGKDIDSALSMLRFTNKRAAVMVRQTLDSAIAAAEDDDVDITRLVVAESRVDEGMHIKRFRPKDRGRAHPYKKYTSHIVVAVEQA